MSPLRVLITNNTLAARRGSELYVRDLALSLLERGHTPIAYSTVLGEVAHELLAATVPVVDDLNRLAVAPDVIHGQHHMETMTALLHFPGVPAIQFCHSWSSWHETPLHFPRILRYVAVDHTCRDRLIFRHAIPEGRIRLLFNFVDLERFKPRTSPLPPRPRRALVFSNYANEKTQLPAVREACARTSIKLDVIGSGAKNASASPENTLGEYDIVFGKGRCALEALAVGSAVILCDASGVGPMVTVENLNQLRQLNFGIRSLRKLLSPDVIVPEIEQYNPEDATEVSKIIRATAGRDSVVDELVGLYEEVRQESERSGNDSLCEEGRAAATYLRQLKIDFATHGASSLRLRERLERFPLLASLGMRLARMIAGHPGR